MRFKIINSKAASASNSPAIAKFANAGVGDFGRIGIIHGVDQYPPRVRRCINLNEFELEL